MSAFNAVLVVVFVFTGASNGLDCKWQFQTCVPSIQSKYLDLESDANNCPRGQRYFNKPWAQNLMMFMGEFSLLIVYVTTRAFSRAWRSPSARFAKPNSLKKPSIFVFLLPACCDFLGTGLQAVGLMYVSAAVAQMMKSSMVLFSAGLTVIFLKKRLLGFHYVALLVTVLGLASVGYAALGEAEGGQGNFHQTAIGLSIILLGILCNAFQFVFEEYLLSGYSVSAQWVVGLEGMWGILIQSFFLMVFMHLPGHDNGVIEDSQDTLEMFSGEDSHILQFLAVFFMMCVSCGQLCGMTITKRLSAVTRCMLSNFQTVLVWLVTLGLYYGGYEQYGGPWTPYSWFQLAGFILAITGTMIYNEILKVPFLKYEQEPDMDPGPALWSPKITDAADRFDQQVSDIHVWSPATAHTFDPLSPMSEFPSTAASSTYEYMRDAHPLGQPLMNGAKSTDELDPHGLGRPSSLFVICGAEFLRQLSD